MTGVSVNQRRILDSSYHSNEDSAKNECLEGLGKELKAFLAI